MPRARLDQITTLLAQRVRRDVVDAAGANGVLSKAEQAKAAPVIQQAAQAARAAGAKRLTADVLEPYVKERALALIGTVNQASGAGKAFLSLDEARALASRDPSLGGMVLEAYEVASGARADVDAAAEAHVNRGLDADQVFRRFRTEAEAMAFRGPAGKHVVWLVKTGEGAHGPTYTSGRDDLWAQRFEVDRRTGAVTVTAEH